MENIQHEQQDEIAKKFSMKTFARSIDPRKMVAFKDLSKHMSEMLSTIETEILKVQHNQVEFGKYLDDIVERLERIEKKEKKE